MRLSKVTADAPAISAPKFSEQAFDLGVTHGRRRPINVNDRYIVSFKITRKIMQADIDHRDLGSQQFTRFSIVLWPAILGWMHDWRLDPLKPKFHD
jgi:hypothetical protein